MRVMIKVDFQRVASALQDTYGCEKDDEQAFEILVSHIRLFPVIGLELKHALLNVLADGSPEDCMKLVEHEANRYMTSAEEARKWLTQLKHRLLPVWEEISPSG
jgi:hypothetical protein